MPYRPEAELKRPDLKGEFLCGHCGKTFCHAASLNRHRLNFHGDDQQCLVCNKQIPHNDTVRRHMQQEHDIPRVFTCGCCNWTFPDKKELHSHNNSMLKTGTPGEAKTIAISSRPPGSLSQHELRGEERSPRIKKRSSKAAANQQAPETDHLMTMLASLLSAQQSAPAQAPTLASVLAPIATPAPQQSAIPASWISHLLSTNPALIPFLSTSSTSSTTSSSSEMDSSQTPEPSSLDTALTAMMNNNDGESSAPSTSGEAHSGAEEENIDEDRKDLIVKVVGVDFLSVKTEQPVSGSMSSGGESGIGSAPPSNTPSPNTTSSIQSTATDFVQDVVQKAKRANKRRSIDDICFNLVAKRAFL